MPTLPQEPATLHTCRDILQRPLPKLLTREGYQTVSNALHRSYFNGRLTRWIIKDDAVKAALDALDNDKVKDHLYLSSSVQSVLQNPFSVERENYLCGDEQSVCGRYSQNALQPAAAVGLSRNIGTRFGDFKTCEESKSESDSIPDFVGVASDPYRLDFEKMKDHDVKKPMMKLLGEAKTPWKHNLLEYYKKFTAGDGRQIRHALGQVAGYMHQFKMKYGFLTTYDYTIFIKQVISPGEEPELAISQPFAFDKTSFSVREFLYYLLTLTTRPDQYTAENPLAFEYWVIKTPAALPTQVPRTPHMTLASSEDTKLLMTPSPNQITTDVGGPLKLFRMPSQSGWTAVVQFKPEEVYMSEQGESYVIMNGEPVSVTIQQVDTTTGDAKIPKSGTCLQESDAGILPQHPTGADSHAPQSLLLGPNPLGTAQRSDVPQPSQQHHSARNLLADFRAARISDPKVLDSGVRRSSPLGQNPYTLDEEIPQSSNQAGLLNTPSPLERPRLEGIEHHPPRPSGRGILSSAATRPHRAESGDKTSNPPPAKTKMSSKTDKKRRQ
ncbi:hypothetical protein FQN50_001738 [Emmonsiellopsis sp. PD_5]|nr:hypothetical protein FQN50_001738 [Emmonsiellopsis sp. PD_5]